MAVGPRRLWDEVLAAYLWWRERGAPEVGRFGLAVGRSGQRVCFDGPQGEVWAVPAEG
ncbi:hypothetical protein ABZ682_16475 [Streptomyces griseoviridis]|uniref:hypothetical protein n=1 Tax=Streptomyces griseoviridis TaxID=45398 RepID=UPI00340FDE82